MNLSGYAKSKAAKGLTVYGSLAVYLFALVFLPALHVHDDCCSSEQRSCACGHHSEHDGEHDEASVTSADPCELCQILHTSVPMSDGLPPILERPSETSYSTPLLSVLQPVEFFRIPPCRAPPAFS